MAVSSGITAVSNNRTIALVDMDCFYVQVEQRRNPELKGKPCVVVQYKKWRGGGIIAVSYEARKFGISRQMRGNDAKEKCPDVNVIYVQENRGKADLTIYREAGAEVIKVLSTFSDALERASIDEAYIDLTDAIKRYRTKYNLSEIASKLLETTHIINIPTSDEKSVNIRPQSHAFVLQRLGLDSNLNLAVGAIVASEMREAVFEKTGFTCSAGIAHNKMLAKLVGGMHKPKQQTIIFTEDIPKLYEEVKISKVRHLGGKLGQTLQESFNIENMKELASLPITQLRKCFGDKTGEWIYSIGQGIDNEPIRIRQLQKSVGCCKNFRGPDKLDKISKVMYWLQQLASEICERLDHEIEVNNRTAKHMSVSLNNVDGESGTRSCKINRIDVDQISSDALRLLQEFNTGTFPDQWDPPAIFLGISASKFEEANTSGIKSIKDFFAHSASKSNCLQNSSTILQNTSSKRTESSARRKQVKSVAKGATRLEKFFSHHHKNRDTAISDCHKQIISIESPTNSSAVTKANLEAEEELNEVCDEDEKFENQLKSPDNKHTFTSEPEMSSCEDIDKLDGKPNIDEHGAIRAGLQDTLTTNGNKEESSPFLVTKDDFTQCLKCGKKILSWNLPEHEDFHFAEELQSDLNKCSGGHNRISLQNNRKISPPKKKVKRSSSSIKSFFETK